uniref:odorant receptor 131-2-like n=1 Tax=Doryrhamphus excisus TaxID=161450 RepID=UPI0025AE9181|nr:odorant receptor 131-2-like [Doryrhamphus excisus]
MNAQLPNASVVVEYRDPFIKAVIKNVIVVAIGLSINYINIGLMHTFCKHQIFYTNPRYILFFHLVLNDMILVSLTVVLFVISYTLHEINMCVCATFILLAVVVTENTPLNLACMAAECYIAVCLPLQHANVCTVNRTLIFIALIWTTSMISALPDLFVTLATEPLDFFSSSVFCLRNNVFRNPLLSRKRDITYILYLVLLWLVIFYTYFKILYTAKMASKDGKKARKTMYTRPLLKEALLRWFPQNASDSLFACYIIVHILPRSISPIIYGVRDKYFCKYLMRYVSCRSIRHPDH